MACQNFAGNHEIREMNFVTSGKKIVTLKKQEADMKKSERRIRRAVLITGTVLCMGLSAFPAAAAGRIQKISLYLEGEQAKPGQFFGY